MAADRSLPPLYMPNASKSSPEKAVMLQQYMALHAQHASLERRLSTSSQSPPTSPKSVATISPSLSSSKSSSPTSSPTYSDKHCFSQISPPTYSLPVPKMRKTSQTPSMEPIPEDASIDDIDFNDCQSPMMSPDERKLFEVSHEIKTTLTELLNCPAVRHDDRTRLWVQTRLLDAEKELKRQRRRRVSAPAVGSTSSSEEGSRRSSG